VYIRKSWEEQKNTATAALRGEIGSSAMKTRIMTNKILYVQSIMTRSKEVTKCILDKMKEEKDKWWRNVDCYLTELNETQECLRRLNKEEIKNKTRKLDSEKWKEELESKVSLKIYKEWKREIKEEDIYDNRFSSVVLFRARTNTLALNSMKRHSGGNTNCSLCDSDMEDMIHFIYTCPVYNEERRGIIELQRPYEENLESSLGRFLFEGKNMENKKELLYKMWKKRERKMKNL